MTTLPAPGTRVHVQTSSQSYEGQLLAGESDVLVLKLDSGYNVGILPKHITELKELAPPAQQEKAEHHVTQNTNLPKIALIHTGGTIASRVDYKTGAVVADFDPAALLELFPELQDIATIESTFLGNMFSDDFRFAHFNKIATAIHSVVKQGQRNIIVTSGTDFLHYLSAGLAFLFKDVDVAILVVGSQRSSDRGSSDAGMNLICAAQFLTTTQFTGVGICMHANSDDDDCVILPGVNARKMHASRRDAFKSINNTPLAIVNYTNKEVTLLQELPKRNTEALAVEAPQFIQTLKIGMYYAHPNMYAQELEPFKNFDGLVLAGSGLGHFPCTEFDEETSEHTNIKNVLSELAKKIPVVMSTQTLYGKVNMNVYSQGRTIQSLGVLGNYSAMTPETTFMKLAYLLSTQQDLALLDQNLVGEQDIETFQDFTE